MHSSNVSEVIIKRLLLTIDIIDENWLKSMKIKTHNSLDLRFLSISDINRLITIDKNRLQSILSIIEFHRLGVPGYISVICLGIRKNTFSGIIQLLLWMMIDVSWPWRKMELPLKCLWRKNYSDCSQSYFCWTSSPEQKDYLKTVHQHCVAMLTTFLCAFPSLVHGIYITVAWHTYEKLKDDWPNPQSVATAGSRYFAFGWLKHFVTLYMQKNKKNE